MSDHPRPAPIVIAVAGGTGSGKTTVSARIRQQVGDQNIAYLPHDAYYKDLKDAPQDVRDQVNFDHPESLETTLMIAHVEQLKRWETVETPIYDFTNDRRKSETRTVQPRPVILIDGILVLVEPDLRALCDIKIFVDADADIRFIRRLKRDLAERGRTLDSVIDQYINTVRQMHLEFVEPSKRYADVIIPRGGFNDVAVDMVVDRIFGLLNARLMQAAED